MARKKAPTDQLLKFEIKTRVNSSTHQRLSVLLTRSHRRSMSELVRDVLENRPLILYTRDESLDVAMEGLTGIQKELRAIGANINQITHYFHGASVGE